VFFSKPMVDENPEIYSPFENYKKILKNIIIKSCKAHVFYLIFFIFWYSYVFELFKVHSFILLLVKEAHFGVL